MCKKGVAIMKEVDLVQLGRTISNTSATPIICKASDGEHYYVKFFEGVEGPRELVNEFIGYKLAKLLKLPIPPAVLMRIPSESYAYIGENMIQIQPNHFAFGSKEITKAVSLINEDFFVQCENKQDLLPIILFDHIIANSDREYNTGNMLFRFQDKVIYIIDHGRIFDVGALWDAVSCKQRKDEIVELKDFSENSLYGKIIRSIKVEDYVRDCRERFSKIEYQDIKKIFDEIPSTWNCSDEERKSGAEYLWNRFVQYNDIIDKIRCIKI